MIEKLWLLVNCYVIRGIKYFSTCYYSKIIDHMVLTGCLSHATSYHPRLDYFPIIALSVVSFIPSIILLCLNCEVVSALKREAGNFKAFVCTSFTYRTSFDMADESPLPLCCRCLSTILCYSYSTRFCSLTLLTSSWGVFKFLSSVFCTHHVLRVYPQVLIGGEREAERRRDRDGVPFQGTTGLSD